MIVLRSRLDLSKNNLTEVDGSLGKIPKLKVALEVLLEIKINSNFSSQELNLVNNPLKDNRLRKLCEQKGTKAVLDYIKAHSGKEGKGKGGGKGGKKGKKSGKQVEVDEEMIDDEVEELSNTLRILSFSEDYPEILVSDLVKEVTKTTKKLVC